MAEDRPARRRAVPIIPYIPFPSGTVQVAAGGITATSMGTGAVSTASMSQGAADKVWSTAARALTDKAGFTLTAGSYSVRASSTQRGTMSLASAATQTAAISSVTTTRATEGYSGNSAQAAAPDTNDYIALTAAAVVTGTRVGVGNGVNVAAFVVTELL